MKHENRVLGAPEAAYRDTKANIEAIPDADLEDGALAFTTDTQELGTFSATSGIWTWYSAGGGSPSEGRLTLETGVAVSTSDQTAKTTLYFTPYQGNRIALYDGSAWRLHAFTERSISLAGLTANTLYDVFIYNNAGTLTLELTAWTNSGAGTSARATALALQDGIYVKSGAATRRYLGTIRTTGTIGQCEDSRTKRFVWNNANRVRRSVRRAETTFNWTYSTATWRYLNNSSANRIEVIVGLAEESLSLLATVLVSSTISNSGVNVGIGQNSSTAVATGLLGGRAVFATANEFVQPVALFTTIPALGYHFFSIIELGFGSGIQTWYGSNNADTAGAIGEWAC